MEIFSSYEAKKTLFLLRMRQVAEQTSSEQSRIAAIKVELNALVKLGCVDFIGTSLDDIAKEVLRQLREERMLM